MTHLFINKCKEIVISTLIRSNNVIVSCINDLLALNYYYYSNILHHIDKLILMCKIK